MATEKLDSSGSGRDARRLLNERLQREEMGDEAYDRMIAENGDSAVRKFGIAFIVMLGLVVLVVTGLGW